MDLQKDNERKMVEGCKQIVDCINRMSFNKELSDQQVRSLVKMREIARGVINGRHEKVTESDVDRALRIDIDSMVDDCKEILEKISRMSCKGLNDQQVHSLSRIKELAIGVVGKQFEVPRTPRNIIGEKHAHARVDTPSPTLQSHATGTNSGDDFGLEGIDDIQVCSASLADDGSPLLVEVFEDPNVAQSLTASDLQESLSSVYKGLLKQSAERKEREQKLMVQISEMENILKENHSKTRDKMLMEQIRALKSTLEETSSSTAGFESAGAVSSSLAVAPLDLSRPEVILGDNEVEARPLKIRARRAPEPEVPDQPPMVTRLRARGGQCE